MLMPPKFVPITLKLCQHNWSKPSEKYRAKIIQQTEAS